MVDGNRAADIMRSWSTCDPGMCLGYVWAAYKAVGARVDGSWPTAYSAWGDTPGKHEGDWNAPRGYPVWFGQRADGTATGAAGDVVISLGDGRCVATDWPRYGVIGECTLAERQAQISRPLLGWTETILGVPIEGAAHMHGTTTPAHMMEGDDVAIYYRKASTGEVGRFANGVKIFGSLEDYVMHYYDVKTFKEMNPDAPVTMPPEPTRDAEHFVNLDDHKWNLEIAIHGGVY